eukprot:6189853-Pleurochrysis_carterae.AAC.2
MSKRDIHRLRSALEKLEGTVMIIQDVYNEQNKIHGALHSLGLFNDIPTVRKESPVMRLVQSKDPTYIYSHEELGDGSPYITRVANTNVYAVNTIAMDYVAPEGSKALETNTTNLIELVTNLSIAVMIVQKCGIDSAGSNTLDGHNLLNCKFAAMIPPDSTRDFVNSQLNAHKRTQSVHVHDLILRRMLFHSAQLGYGELNRVQTKRTQATTSEDIHDDISLNLHSQRVFILGHICPKEVCRTINSLRPIPILDTYHDGKPSSSTVLTLAYARGEILWMDDLTKFVEGDVHTPVPLFIRSLHDVFTHERITLSTAGLASVQRVQMREYEQRAARSMLHGCDYPLSTQAIRAENIFSASTDIADTVSACYWTCEYPMDVSYSELHVLQKISPEYQAFATHLNDLTHADKVSDVEKRDVAFVWINVRDGSMSCRNISDNLTLSSNSKDEEESVRAYTYKSASVLTIILDVTFEELLRVDLKRGVCAPNLVGEDETNVCVKGLTHGVHVHPHVQALFPFVHNLYILEDTCLEIED